MKTVHNPRGRGIDRLRTVERRQPATSVGALDWVAQVAATDLEGANPLPAGARRGARVAREGGPHVPPQADRHLDLALRLQSAFSRSASARHRRARRWSPSTAADVRRGVEAPPRPDQLPPPGRRRRRGQSRAGSREGREQRGGRPAEIPRRLSALHASIKV